MSHSKPANPDRSPLSTHKLRILGILLGGCLLVWLPFEDNNDRWVLTLAAAICSLAATQILLRLEKRFGRHGYWLPLAGVVAGALVTPAALLLMAIKTGLHGHQPPDFTGEQIQSVMIRTPVWLISGLLVGLGVEIFRRANHPHPGESNQP